MMVVVCLLALVKGEVQRSVFQLHLIADDGVHITLGESRANQIHVNVLWNIVLMVVIHDRF